MAITYRGITLPYGKHSDSTTERSAKPIAFPAVDGTQEMHMGKRQRSFSVLGLIVDLSGSFNKNTIEGWNDTSTGTLNVHGTEYTYVRMLRCDFGQAYKDVVTSKIACPFAIEFRKIR